MYLREHKAKYVLHIIIILVNMIYANGSLDDKSRELINLHEKYRQDLVNCKVDGQPPAKYMSPLKWNYNLAAQAQTLANKCILQHDKRHSDEFSWVGQNIALHPTIKSGVDAWFNEHKLYDYNHNDCMKCLHYTQMAWAKTTDIGCGVASCPKYGLSIVCNYGPGGNWNNEKPYEVKSRELCPKMQNIPKESFQTTRDDTQRAPSSIVNVNHKLSSIGSSEGNVNDQPSTGLQTTLDDKSLEILELHRKYRQDLVNCKVDGQPPAKYMSPLMAWAKTTDIGCGVASCPKYGLSIVCNYGPGGNWNNEKPYEVKSREFCPSAENTNIEIFVPSTINQLDEFTMSNVLNYQTVSLDKVNNSNDGNHMNIQMLNKTLPEPNIIMNGSICYYISH
ncbi:hypothetical protein MS3_00011030 [Schistosoma haematobium]|uniref:SCP domain-containing protein n=1 Tax=Schistosoma haematobium TaxID=6185 RepID=A0A922IJX6_SCHHA|nr:hypothetical protein MS3_00011030 [Schistosoma haematobium]KAH9581220.1 hypothetical protein MS3_00011030 [Schistosoma haematobium]